MRNPFRKKKELPLDISLMLEQLANNPQPIIDNFSRELLFDSQMRNPLAIADALGLPPISDELADKEFEESEKRIAKVDWLIPIFGAISHLLSSAYISQSMIASEGDEEIPDEFWELLHNRLETFGVSVLLTTISTLQDTGIIDVGVEL
jgi:hypothetical protein